MALSVPHYYKTNQLQLHFRSQLQLTSSLTKFCDRICDWCGDYLQPYCYLS
ncbi:hypothetical protein Hdeb2414_s0009g00321401 [Helianthus debilis subsp. tardiflorus]